MLSGKTRFSNHGVLGRWGAWPGSRPARRFLAIARQAGWRAALRKAGRKLQAICRLWTAPLMSIAPLSAWASGRPLARLDPYAVWTAINRSNPERQRRLREALESIASAPLFSVLMPLYNTPPGLLDQAIASVAAQSYESWELVIVDDGSSDRAHFAELESWSRREPRVKMVLRDRNGGISLATNAAAEHAIGDFLLFLDHDDLLHPDALAHLALALNAEPEADLLYTDDDKISLDGKRQSPQFKPHWSPELLLWFCYVGHLKAARASLFRAVGGMRAGFEGSQDHDFFLRASERARRVVHVPHVLYHWRLHPGSTAKDGRAKPQSFEAGRRAVEEAFRRRGLDCRVIQSDWARQAGCAVFEPVMPDDGPSVAIIVMTSNARSFSRLMASLRESTYRNFQIYVIDQARVLDRSNDLALRTHEFIVVSAPEASWPSSKLRNAAVKQASEELMLFIDDHVEPVGPRWLSQLVGWSRLPGVGAVGPRLVARDGSIAGAGYVLHSSHGLIGRAFENLPPGEQGFMSLARVARNAEAVPMACMLTPRKLFLDFCGFDSDRFPDAFHDVDYGLRLGEQGNRCVVCGEVSVKVPSRFDRIRTPESHEVAELRMRLSGRSDQYYSPHLRLEDSSFQVQATVVPAARRNRPIRALAVTHNLNWEGAPLIQLDLLSRLKEEGAIEPLVLSPSAGPLRSRYEQSSIEVVVRSGYDNASGRSLVTDEWIQELSDWIVEQQFELVHANTAHSYWAIAAARAARVPAVWSIHESEPWAVLFADLARSQARTALECLDHPYRVVFASRGSAQVWSSLERAGNFTIVPTPLDIARFRERLSEIDRVAARRKLSLAEDDVCVIVLGTVCPRKGQHDLARAYAALPRDVARRARCFVVGLREGLPYGVELTRLIARLPTDRRDRFTIVAETDQTALYWNAADLFCCTSRIESYPRVILEAMECGLPIITTPVFGIIEQVAENGNALFYRPGDYKTLSKRLTTLISDRELRDRMGRESPRVLRSLVSQDEMIDQYRRIFLAAADSNPVSGPWERSVPLVA